MSSRLRDLLAFELVGSLYRAHFLIPSWRRWPDAATNPWEGMAVFLSGYAFERQGRSPRFAPTAVEVAELLQASGRNIEQENLGKEAWDSFSQKLDRRSLNHANNPMAPKRTPFTRNGRELRTAGPSVFELARGFGRSIVGHALGLIGEGRTRVVYEQLASVNGVGPKIASFFLRDVALRYAFDAGAERELLQPVDVWVQRAAARFWFDGVVPASDVVARRIVTESANDGVNPEFVNAGMWYFGAQIARSDRVLDACARDAARFDQLLRDYVEALRSVVRAYEHADKLN